MARVRLRVPLVVTALVVGAVVAGSGQAAAPDPAWLDAYREPAARLIGAALADTAAWTRLAELTDTFGHRLAGSKALEDDHRLGPRRDVARRARKRARRAGHGAALGPRARTGRTGVARAPSPGDARPRQQRGHAPRRASRPRPSSCGASTNSTPAARPLKRQDRRLQRALDRLRPDGAVPQFRREPGRRPRRGRRCCCDRSASPGCARRIPARSTTHPNSPRIPAAAIANEDADRLQRLPGPRAEARGPPE